MIYDGQCGFCRLWIERWKKITGDAVAYAPFQDVSDQFPTIPEDQFKSSVQFVETDGTIYSGAAAVFKSLSYARRRKWMFWCYKNIPGASFVTESIYQFIANHRPLFSKLTTLFWGKTVEPPTYLFSSWLFIKALAIIYGIAFFSLWIQIRGLIGTDGILPIESFLKAIKGHVGSSAYFWFPTLAWLSPTNFFLDFLSMGGVILSIILFLGFTPTIALWLLWVFYLSLTVAGSEFMQFQWDALLLETGFLSIFLFHSQIRSRWKQFVMPSHLIHFLLRWLLFRLVFSSGVVKLISGDPAWHSFTALNYHYETQPLPTPIAWYVHQLPEWFDKVSCGFMFASELFVPFLIFFPRRFKFFAFALLMFFQITIALTGNYTHFNWLTIALSFLLLDDSYFTRWVFHNWHSRQREPKKIPTSFLRQSLISVIALFVLIVSGTFMIANLSRLHDLPSPLKKIMAVAQTFHFVNSYGLFAVMTTERNEIVLEGSYDNKNWFAYEFKYKPGELKRRPPFVAPHQPRLDWQMWFLPLQDFQRSFWFQNFLMRLYQGAPDVIALLEKNPFEGKPPKYLRIQFYEYHFTDFAAKKSHGAWWRRTLKATLLYARDDRSK